MEPDGRVVEMERLRRILGHASYFMVMRYLHLDKAIPSPPSTFATAALRTSGHRRSLGAGEIDLRVRLPAAYRQRLFAWRRERGLTLAAAVADLMRRRLEQPPPRPPSSGLAEARSGLVQKAGLACLLAIEQTRLYLEAAMPAADEDADDLVNRAVLAAEDRLTAARRALEQSE